MDHIFNWTIIFNNWEGFYQYISKEEMSEFLKIFLIKTIDKDESGLI